MVRIGINIPQYAVDFAEPAAAAATIVALGRLAEEHGLDDVWVSDHPFVVGPDGGVSGALEAFVVLGMLAATTRRIGLGTLVLASTMREPALVAHMARSLPAHRLTVGAGAGWYRPEHDAYGMTLPPLGDRVMRMEQTLRAAREAGARTLAGGVGNAAIAVASRVADVWNAAWDPPPDAFHARAAALSEASARTGRSVARSVGLNVLVAPDEAGVARAVARLRDRAPFLAGLDAAALRRRIVCGAPSECADRIAAYAADEVVVTLALRDDPEMLALFATEVVPRLRS